MELHGALAGGRVGGVHGPSGRGELAPGEHPTRAFHEGGEHAELRSGELDGHTVPRGIARGGIEDDVVPEVLRLLTRQRSAECDGLPARGAAAPAPARTRRQRLVHARVSKTIPTMSPGSVQAPARPTVGAAAGAMLTRPSDVERPNITPVKMW